MPFVEKEITDLKKSRKEQENAMTRFKICPTVKQSMSKEVTDNKLLHEKGLHSSFEYVSDLNLKNQTKAEIMLKSDSCSENNKNECENVSHGTEADICNKPSGPALILQVLQGIDETEVKEFSDIIYQSESHDEKCDPEKSFDEDHTEDLNNMNQDEDTDIDSTQNIDSCPIISGIDERERKQFLASDDIKSVNVTDQTTSLNISSPDMIENFAVDINENDKQLSVHSGIVVRESVRIEQSDAKDKPDQKDPTGRLPVIEIACESLECLCESDGKYAHRKGYSAMNNATILECVAVLESPLDNPDESVEVNCTSFMQKEELEVQPTISLVETRNKLSADILSIESFFDEAIIKRTCYQIVCLESSDMNESYKGIYSLLYQRMEYVKGNLKDTGDQIKRDHLLKKMPLSMDNRFFSPLDVQEKCSNKRKNKWHTRKHHSKRQKAVKVRKIQKTKKSEYRKKFRGGHQGHDPVQQTSVFSKRACSSLPKQQSDRRNGPPDNKDNLPERDHVQLRSCRWRCRKCMNGHSNSGGSRSNNDACGGQRAQRGGRGGPYGKGHQSGNGNNGSGDNNDDGDNDENERKRFQNIPNIVREEEEENSDDENNQDVQENVDNPRPPEVNSVDEASALARQPDAEHSALTTDELCLFLGFVSTRPLFNIFDGQGHALNLCFTKIMHQLEFAGPFTDCSVCQILGAYFQHMKKADHSDVQCSLCREICTMAFHHVKLCIAQTPPPTHRSSTDLCYKICQKVHWNVMMLTYDQDFIKMIFKYCSNILEMPPLQMDAVNEQTSASANYGSSLTNQNAPALATAFANDNANNVIKNAAHKQPAPNAIAQETRVPTGHAPLARKASNQRPPLSIPPSIVEEKSEDENPDEKFPPSTASQSSAADLSARPKSDEKSAESMPEGSVHDVTQFRSFVDQPTGTRGIGEVTFADSRRLCLVARYWQVKREECEKTERQPSQLREEGVILEKYKSLFNILGTRYQNTSQWELLTALGYGMHGRCFLAMDMETKHRFCAKKIDLLHYEANELCLWADLDSPYIVKLYGAIRHGYVVYILSEFIDGGDLASIINQQRDMGFRLSHWTAIKFFQQLLKALEYLYSQNILHEDIKAENILVRGSSPQILVTDFGISCRLQAEVIMKNKWPLGTATHFSPEKATCEGHGYPADLWAAVCVLVYMMSGKLPWHQYLTKAGCLNYIIYMRPPPMDDLPHNIQEVVRDLIVKGFVKEPEHRPSASELLRHPAFKILFEDTPESFYSTLATGLNSVGGGHGKATEKKVGIVQSAQKVLQQDDTNSVQQSADSDTVLYSLLVNLDGGSVLDEAEVRVAEAKQNSPSGNLHGPVSRQIAGPQGSEANLLSTNASPVQSPAIGTLPRLEDLLSSVNRSISEYFTDTYDSSLISVERSEQPSNLELFGPYEAAPCGLPNLSIFDGSWDTGSILGERMPLPDFGNEHGESPTDQDSYHEDQSVLIPDNPSSCDFSSNERLPSGSQDLQYAMQASASEETIITKEVKILGDPSSLAPNRTSGVLMKKKPANLSLNVSGVTQKDAQPSHEGQQKRKSTYTATSSTSYSSSHSSHSYTQDIHAEQARLFKDMTSSHSSELRNFFADDNDSDVELENENPPPVEKETDVKSSRLTDETPLVGKKISFYNEINVLMFSFRFLSTPVRLHTHLSEINRKIYQLGFKHFELSYKDGSVVSYSSDLECEQLKIVAVTPVPGEPCPCAGCLHM